MKNVSEDRAQNCNVYLNVGAGCRRGCLISCVTATARPRQADINIACSNHSLTQTLYFNQTFLIRPLRSFLFYLTKHSRRHFPK